MGVNPKCFKCQRWLCHVHLSGACDGHEIGPPGQGRRLQGLLGTLLGLSWERRAEYDDICGHKVCVCCSPITHAQISSGREMIDSLQKEWTTTQALQKAREKAEERVKIIPAQIFTLIISWAAISTIKQSVGLYTLTLDTQTAIKNINCLLWLLPQVMGPCRRREPSLRAPSTHASTSVYFPHLTIGGNRLVYWCFRPYTFSYSERVWITAEICCILPLDCGGWGNMGHGGWYLHTLSAAKSDTRALILAVKEHVEEEGTLPTFFFSVAV